MAAWCTMGTACLTPVVSGFMMLFHPLRKSNGNGEFQRVTDKASVDAMTPGIPRPFNLEGTVNNAWNSFPNQPVGTIYLVRNEAGELQAFQAQCPHQGCLVDYRRDESVFFCPCHKATFQPSGQRVPGVGPECRDLDKLEVKVQGEDVLVRYQEFRTGALDQVELS